MELIEMILNRENFNEAIKEVKSNHGAPGIDQMTVDELPEHFDRNYEKIVEEIKTKTYKPKPVRRVYIPKPNSDKKRPLGIPTVVERVIQQAVARVLTEYYDSQFSEYSYGFRPQRDCHKAMKQALEYLNMGKEWVIDFDIEKYFDTVNHDKYFL